MVSVFMLHLFVRNSLGVAEQNRLSIFNKDQTISSLGLILTTHDEHG